MKIAVGAFALLAAAAVTPPTSGAQAPERPFPTHTSYVDGSIRPDHLSQAQLDQEVVGLYEQWRDDYLTQNPYEPDQYYVDYSEEFTQPPDAVTTSESTGYGMLATAIMAGADPQAKVYFDGLYRFYRAHPSANDPNLMAWQQADRDGAIITVPGGGESSATDGDLDIAYALLLASEQWGDDGAIDYGAAVESIIDAILASDVQADDPILALGDWAPDDATYGNGTRSSDWMLQHQKEFEAATGDNGWTDIVDKTYELADALHPDYSSATGLLPDFAVYADGAPEPAPPSYLESPNDGSYSWNATRAPWRLATDHLITGDARGKAQLDAINAWIRSATGGDPAEIDQGYELDGTPIDPSTDAHTAFSAPFMVSALVDASNQAWLNDLWDYNVSEPSRGYYGDSIRLFSAIVVSGNWWSPSEDVAPPVTATTVDPPEPNGDNGWYTTPPTVRLSASGCVDFIEYRINTDGSEGDWAQAANDGGDDPFEITFTISEDGEHVVEYRAVDCAGNEDPGRIELKVDTSAPTTTAALDPPDPGADGSYDGPVGVTLSATDGVSGVERTEYRVITDTETGEWVASENTGGDDPFETAFTVSPELLEATGSDRAVQRRSPVSFFYEVEYRSVDGAGNEEDVGSVEFEITIGGPEARLKVTGAPRLRTVGPRARQVAFRLRAKNPGDADTGRVRLCVLGPPKRVKVMGPRCVVRNNIAAGKKKVRRVKVRIKPAARGTISPIRLIGKGPDVDPQRVVVRLRVRR